MNRLFKVALSALAVAVCPGAPRTSLRFLYQEADAAIIGAIESSNPKILGDAHPANAPLQPTQMGDVYPCEIDIRIEGVIKNPSRALPVALSGKVTVLSFLPSRDCIPRYERQETLLGRSALWLLRTDRGTLRTLVDNSSTEVTLDRGLSNEDRDALASLENDNMRAMFILARPGLAVSARDYAQSNLPLALADIDDWTRFLTVYQLAFVRASSYERSQMELKSASFGYCLAAATRVAEGGDRLKEWTTVLPLLNADAARVSDETDLAAMPWRDKQELLALFKGRAEAISTLTFYACGSGAKSKNRARSILKAYFGIESRDLPCLPCD